MAETALLDVTNRFDGAAIWPTLTREQQADLGAAALNLVVAWRGEDERGADLDFLHSPFIRAAEQAASAAQDDLIIAFDAAIAAGAIETPSGQLRLPTTIGMICEACGCSQGDACESGCDWARDNRCTGCVESAPPAAIPFPAREAW
jgi:hypothetical protein